MISVLLSGDLKNVNLVAVIDCTHSAIKIMEDAKKTGVVINLGSASGLYPLITNPIYSASKGGVVMFSRSLSTYKRKGIRVNVICLEFIKTDMAEKVGSQFIERMGGYVSMDALIQGTFELITDESKAGACLWITNRRGMEYWPTPKEEANYAITPLRLKKRFSSFVPFTVPIPQGFEKVIVHTLSNNFRNATRIVCAPLKLPIKSDLVLLKIIYAGVNASDLNYSSGSYYSGSKEEISSRLPFDAGFEVPSKHILPVARPDPEVVAMLTSGLTLALPGH